VAAQLSGSEARFMLADAGSPTLIQDTATSRRSMC
jgi:DNA polymerase-3 subunit beta